MSENISIAIAYGDGIGPEIMDATISILKEARAKVHFEFIDIGTLQYERGFISGIAPEAWKIIECNKIILKGPTSVPKDAIYQNASTTLRRKLDLYANVKHFRSYYPFIKGSKPDVDIVVIKENEEGLFAGIERRQTANSYESLKLTTESACQQICNYAFNFAKAYNREKIICLTKDNILRLTDGLFHDVFDDIATGHDIKSEHLNIDLAAVEITKKPEEFDVIVTSNLYGDIISSIASENSGSLNMVGAANIGHEYALFETISNSMPDLAGKDLANPIGMINAAIMMLFHIGQDEVATNIENALLKTIEDGIHTQDIYDEETSQYNVTTKEFAYSVIKRLNTKPEELKPISFDLSSIDSDYSNDNVSSRKPEKKLVGVDILFDYEITDAEELADRLLKICSNTKLKLQLISSRGLLIWPKSDFSNPVGDYWRGRFLPEGEKKITKHSDIIELLTEIEKDDLDFVKSENLYTYDEELGFSLLFGE